MTTDEFTQLLERLGYNWRKYSGRGMMGVECVGVTLEEETTLKFTANVVVGASDDEREYLSDIFGRAKTDSMGYNTIIYFPTMKFTD